MRRAFQWIAVAIGLLMAGCAATPTKQKAKACIPPRLASLYTQIVTLENELPAGAFDPRTFADDDPLGFYQYILSHRTRTEKREMKLRRELYHYFPFASYHLPPEQMAEKRELLDRLQKRFGISQYAMYEMEWSSDQRARYIKRHHSEYGITRMARWSMLKK